MILSRKHHVKGQVTLRFIFFSFVNLFTFHLPFCEKITWYLVQVLQFLAVGLRLYQKISFHIPLFLNLCKSIWWETLLKAFSEIQVNFYGYLCSSTSWLALWKPRRFLIAWPLQLSTGQACVSFTRFPDSLDRVEMSLYCFAVLWLLHTFSINRCCFRHFTVLWC